MTLQLLLLIALPTACHHKFLIAFIPATLSNRKADGAARRLQSCSAAAHSSAAQILWCQQQADQPLKQCTSSFHRSNVSLKARCKSTRRHFCSGNFDQLVHHGRARSDTTAFLNFKSLFELHRKLLLEPAYLRSVLSVTVWNLTSDTKQACATYGCPRSLKDECIMLYHMFVRQHKIIEARRLHGTSDPALL
jgi:hypothetical protein